VVALSAETVSVGAAGALVRALHGGGPPVPALDALTGLPNRVMLASWLAEHAEQAERAEAAAPTQHAQACDGGNGGSGGAGTAFGAGFGAGLCGEAAAGPGRIGLLCLDLDGFRQVNAMLGMGAGDRFLAAVADRLAEATAPGGHLLARTGGDEFAVLVNLSGPDTDTTGLHGLSPTLGPGLGGHPSVDRLAGADGHGHSHGPAGITRPTSTVASTASTASNAGSGLGSASGNRPATAAVATVTALADHILAALREPLTVDGRALTVTASIGAVEAAAAGAVPEQLLRAADLALYWAKGEGRDRCLLFDAERGGADVARYRLAADLPAAVESGQFFCEYQPIVSLADGTIAGVEALVRWRHPRYGVVSPDRFITLAEDSGLIVDLGRRILAEACRAAATWPDRPGQPAPPVSVNVAVRQMRDPGLTGHVLAALDAAGLPPEWLRLEITESALLPGDDTAAAVLRALAGRGVHIAVDDFGTGYSNLAHLRRLPLHILKIDGTFVAGLVAGERPGADEQIISTVTALGHALGLSVTAEGVETAEQFQTVRRLGVDTGQGWYFSRALSAAAIRDLLDSGVPLAA
jgi:predicted signal transduction protein with EAL and GGDEF domain